MPSNRPAVSFMFLSTTSSSQPQTMQDANGQEVEFLRIGNPRDDDTEEDDDDDDEKEANAKVVNHGQKDLRV